MIPGLKIFQELSLPPLISCHPKTMKATHPTPYQVPAFPAQIHLIFNSFLFFFFVVGLNNPGPGGPAAAWCQARRGNTHHVFDGGDDLSKHQLGLQLVQLPPGGDPGEQVSAAAILHHQVQLLAALQHLVKTHYVRVAQLLHTADLGRRHALAPFIQTLLVYDFDGYPL